MSTALTPVMLTCVLFVLLFRTFVSFVVKLTAMYHEELMPPDALSVQLTLHEPVAPGPCTCVEPHAAGFTVVLPPVALVMPSPVPVALIFESGGTTFVPLNTAVAFTKPQYATGLETLLRHTAVTFKLNVAF